MAKSKSKPTPRVDSLGFKTGAKCNGLRRISETEEGTLKSLQQSYLTALAADHKFVMSLRPGIRKELRGLREQAAQVLKDHSPDWVALNDLIERDTARRIERMLHERPSGYLATLKELAAGAQADMMPPPPGGEFWWSDTFWHFPEGLNASWLSDGLHFFGRRDYKGVIRTESSARR